MDFKRAMQGLLGRIRTSDPARAKVDVPEPRVSQDVTLHSVLAGLRANQKYELERLAKNPQRRTVERVVDNRVFILGLNELFRTGATPHEHAELLVAARKVASKLGVSPDAGPLEGHYGQDARLSEYFHLVRALQHTSDDQRSRVEDTPEFQQLADVFSTPLFGSTFAKGTLLPRGVDPLTVVMSNTTGEPSMADVLERARTVALEAEDFSLVGLSCLARDPVAIVALRDPVVLSYETSTLANAPIPKYTWRVDTEIADSAERFITTVQALFGEELPAPTAENADLFGASFFELAGFLGRCVRISVTETDKGHYYWAIFADDNGKPRIHEFWSHQPWTTEEYRLAMPVGSKGQARL